jgi:hypothetical protein
MTYALDTTRPETLNIASRRERREAERRLFEFGDISIPYAGALQIQSEGAEVFFRNIELKPIDSVFGATEPGCKSQRIGSLSGVLE